MPILILFYAGVEGGFEAGTGPTEYETTYKIYLHPTKTYLPYPDPSLPEKVCLLQHMANAMK